MYAVRLATQATQLYGPLLAPALASPSFGDWAANGVGVIAAIALLWVVWTIIRHLSQFGLMDGLKVLALGVIIWVMFTKPWSPVYLPSQVDDAYQNYKGSVDDSQMAKDLVGWLRSGEVPASGGGKEASATDEPGGGNNSNGNSSASATEVPGGNSSGGNTNGGSNTSGAQPMYFSSPIRMTSTQGYPISAVKADGSVVTTSDPTALCFKGYKDPATLMGCDAFEGGTISYQQWMQQFNVVPSYAELAKANQPTPQPQLSAAEVNAAKKACWLQWAGAHLKNSNVAWGTDMVPNGMEFTLTGGGSVANFFTAMSNEQWTINITDWDVKYTVNGVAARAVPGFDDGGTINSYGTGTKIFSWCTGK